MKSIGSIAHTSALKQLIPSHRAIRAIIVAGCCLSFGFLYIVYATNTDEIMESMAMPACVLRVVVS